MTSPEVLLVRRGDGVAEGTLVRPLRGGAATHPGLVDAYFQVVAAALPDAAARDALLARGEAFVRDTFSAPGSRRQA